MEEKKEKEKTYVATGKEKETQEFLKTRIAELKDYRESIGIEKEWKAAEEEYLPHELTLEKKRKIFEQNQDTGLRSRMVTVGDSNETWRSANSAPTLLAKIQTALSIIIDNNPEAMLTALVKKYEKTTDLTYSLWKRNWQINDSKEILKKFAFNLAQYGWAVGRTFPRVVKYNKKILTSLDSEDPEKNKYEEKELTWFNDVARENLNPWKVWLDEQTKPYDIFSTNDVYYEFDLSYDYAETQFGDYSNWQYVKKDSKIVSSEEEKKEDEEQKTRKDIVTVGFYENRLKDKFVITIPKDDIILYESPLPNDDGLLSLWHTPWILRSSESPYGVSLWTIIRQDKELYDKMNNMTMDQLVLSIMKFGFYTGTDAALGNGKINIVPGQARKIINGEVKWMEIPGPGKDAFEGKKQLQASMDDNSGINPTLEGELTGKTLGEIQLAREASLKRLKIPIENIANAIESDAYLTISWMSQVYSIPEVKKFTSKEEMDAYNLENEAEPNEVFEDREGQNFLQKSVLPPNGYTATYLPELALHLEDREGQLMESKESRFFQIGRDIQPAQIKWRGIFKVIPKSLLGTSEIIIKQTKNELFNLLVPLLSMPPEIAKKPAIQLCEANEEEPQDWLPDMWFQEVPMGMEQMMMQQQQAQQQQIPPEEQPLFVPKGGTMQNQGGTAPNKGGGTVVPKANVSSPQTKSLIGGLGSLFRR